MTEQLWQVAVEAPLYEALTYAQPDSLVIERGQCVKVPIGKRQVNGVVLKADNSTATREFAIKNITDIVPDYPKIPEKNLTWLEWLAKYYHYPVGQVLSLAWPPLKRQTKARKSQRPPVVPQLDSDQALKLTPEQDQAFQNISKFRSFSSHLLFGVTGSGKTEVYLQLLEDTLKQGKRGLVLVPEISLTPQLVHRFASRFGDQIAVLHSQLTDRERTNQWYEMIDKEKKILIGARSALFCPVDDWGLIIVDEEHEASFKQDEKLKYHARDAAIMLAKICDCPILLGSATPSLESWSHAQSGKYHLHTMNHRVEQRSLPELNVVDLKVEKKSPTRPDWMSEILFQELSLALENQEQTALFLNRRGMAQVVMCRSCGYTADCPNCDISLTLHARHHMVCHYCDYHENYKLECPSCKEGELSAIGLGTEKMEEDLKNFFPEARIARADRDEIQSRLDMEELIQKMENFEVDILIGTQMIAKGLDFPKLNLVGLVLADIGFNLPDFRSTERSFQLITQVSGRAGRHVKVGERPGRVIIQTYNPDHPSLQYAIKKNYEEFAKYELENRQALMYPPFGRLIAFRMQSNDSQKAREVSQLLAQRCHQLKQKFTQYSDIEILGPAEAAIAKLRGQYRYHLLLKGQNSQQTSAFCQQVLANQEWLPSGCKLSIDVDPVNLL